MESILVALVDGRGFGFGGKTISTLALYQDIDHIKTRKELDRFGVSTFDIIDKKELRIRTPGAYSWRNC